MDETGTDKTASPGSGSIASLAAQISKDDVQPSGLPGSGRSEAPGALAAELKKVYTPEEILELVKLPADTMYALTRNERWILGKEETEILAAKTAKGLSLIMEIEPKWFILLSMVASWGTVYGTRAVAEYQDHQSKKKKEEKKDEKV